MSSDAPRSDPRQKAFGDRQPCRHRYLGPVKHRRVGQAAGSGRSARAEWPGRSPRPRRRPRRPSVAPVGARTGLGSSTGSRVRSIRNACVRSKRSASGCGLVSTVTSSGGSRRHSSQRYDWIPPIFGGKSLVTSRWRVTIAPAGRTGDDLSLDYRVRVGLADEVERVPSAPAAQTACALTIGSASTSALDRVCTTAGSLGSPTLPRTIKAFRLT